MERPRRIQVASSVKAELARQGVPPERLAESLSIPMSALDRMLSGEADMNLDDLDAMAGALGVSVVSFLAAG
jgi:transcriptional regulator with XRE-family HTH domain